MSTRKSKLDIQKFLKEETPEELKRKTEPKKQSSNQLIDKLTKEPETREKPIRVSLDLTPDMHKKLTNLANRTGRKKSEILRILLEQAFEDIED